MGYITIAGEFETRLQQLCESTELRDRNGNVIGVFTPSHNANSCSGNVQSQEFDLKEADRRMHSNEAEFTTEQVIAHLQDLETKQ